MVIYSVHAMRTPEPNKAYNFKVKIDIDNPDKFTFTDDWAADKASNVAGGINISLHLTCGWGKTKNPSSVITSAQRLSASKMFS